MYVPQIRMSEPEDETSGYPLDLEDDVDEAASTQPDLDERAAWEHSEQQRIARELSRAIIRYPHTVARMVIDGCGTPAETKKTTEKIIEWATGVKVEE